MRGRRAPLRDEARTKLLLGHKGVVGTTEQAHAVHSIRAPASHRLDVMQFEPPGFTAAATVGPEEGAARVIALPDLTSHPGRRCLAPGGRGPSRASTRAGLGGGATLSSRCSVGPVPPGAGGRTGDVAEGLGVVPVAGEPHAGPTGAGGSAGRQDDVGSPLTVEVGP